MESNKKAIVNFRPMIGWFAKVISDDLEVEMILIKHPPENLTNGMEIVGNIVDDYFEINYDNNLVNSN